MTCMLNAIVSSIATGPPRLVGSARIPATPTDTIYSHYGVVMQDGRIKTCNNSFSFDL